MTLNPHAAVQKGPDRTSNAVALYSNCHGLLPAQKQMHRTNRSAFFHHHQSAFAQPETLIYFVPIVKSETSYKQES